MFDDLIGAVQPGDKAVLVGLQSRELIDAQATEYMEELAFLALTAGAEAVARIYQRREAPHPATFVGAGKLKEIGERMTETGAVAVIFDDELSPTQLRNIEKTLETNVLDRTGLILQIFSQHARTAQAKTQVELARLEYTLPRLRKMWSHLGRQRGGVGMKGAGEQEIETDRRMIRTRLAKLKNDLQKLDRQAVTRRKHREGLPRVALVGYTNAGKSTLMNLLAKADVQAENRLFATLDTTVRKVHLQDTTFLLSDTVGFIRKLPHKLVESFKSTLDEVREADLLLHVVDVSNFFYLDHLRVVQRTLAELGALDTPTLLVFNKVDNLDEDDILDLQDSWGHQPAKPAVFVSAVQKRGLEQLRATVLALLKQPAAA